MRMSTKVVFPDPLLPATPINSPNEIVIFSELKISLFEFGYLKDRSLSSILFLKLNL